MDRRKVWNQGYKQNCKFSVGANDAKPSPNKLALHELYNCKCPDCGGHIETLSLSESESDGLQKAFNKMVRWMYDNKKTNVSVNDLEQKHANAFYNEVSQTLQSGVDKGIAHVVPFITQRDLKENIYVFSGAKTFAELKELSGLLVDENGHIKPFNKFWQDTRSIHSDYNQKYLEAEYIFATQSAMMASKWHEFEADGDRYYLQYRTANDDRVRDSHRLMHNITLPRTDPYWNRYFPPNGWRCRCTAVQVRKQKYEATDSKYAMAAGDKATGGNNEIFRFNPGKDNVIFPEHHPYLKSLSSKDREVVNKIASESVGIKTKDDVTASITEINKEKKWFERGVGKLEITQKANVNGSTDMNGNIWLTKERLDKTISGIDKLSKKEEIDFEEADALATYWHEITHNRNKIGNMSMTRQQVRRMELANEYVARNTLDEFYGAFSVDVQHKEFTTNRRSTGYNRMVRNYAKIVEKTELETKDVVSKVKKHLFEERYDKQNKGLTNALDGAKKSDGKKLTKTEINKLVKYCDEKTESDFETYINNLIGSK